MLIELCQNVVKENFLEILSENSLGMSQGLGQC